MTFADKFYIRLADEHADKLQRALDGEQVYIKWFQAMPSIIAWLESLEAFREANREKVIEATIGALEYADDDERAFQVGEVVGRIGKDYERLVRLKHPDMYWFALGKQALYLDL